MIHCMTKTCACVKPADLTYTWQTTLGRKFFIVCRKHSRLIENFLRKRNIQYQVGMTCSNCAGKGFIRKFSNWHRGVCYCCKGRGIL